jgi:perosamine synthetase
MVPLARADRPFAAGWTDIVSILVTPLQIRSMPQLAPEAASALPARAPITPILRGGSLGVLRRSELPTLLDGQRILTTSGRAALALALDALRVGPGDEVLIPAYHCLALSAPIAARRARPVSYRVDEGLGINLDDLRSRITERTKCVVAVHFFGFIQPLHAVRALCDSARLALIEDCAHAFYSPRATPVGRTGDFAIGSLMKFFPIFDGGCLTSFVRPLPAVPLKARGIIFQLKALMHILERSADWSGSAVLHRLIAAVRGISAWLKRRNPALTDQLAEASPAAVFGSIDFEEQWVHARMSWPSRAIVHFADHRRAVARRRHYFAKYLAALTGLPGGEPWCRELPAGVAPYVFPFLLREAAVTFPALRAARVPMYRWEDVDTQTCPTSAHYRQHLVQFPCHQELTEQEVEQVIAGIRQVLAVAQTPSLAAVGGAAR